MHPSRILVSSGGIPVVTYSECTDVALVFHTALPHRVTEEDEYEGYRIPAGANVIASVWLVSRSCGYLPCL